MGSHEDYGKQVMREVAGSAYSDSGASVDVDYGVGRPARIDGIVGSDVAVEIESRVSKQVRGAVLDLICHRYPKKLLLLLPVHMTSPHTTAKQCRFILAKFLDITDFRVVVLRGTGDAPQLESDAVVVKAALDELGCQWEFDGTSHQHGRPFRKVSSPLADRIREFVFREYIKPTRERGERTITVRAGDVHKQMGLSNRMPAVCGAIATAKFQDKYLVQLVNREGPAQGANVFFTFDV